MRLRYHFGLGAALLTAVAIGVGQQTGGHPAGTNSGSGTISSVTSTGSTLTVANAGGPTTNIEINPAHANVYTVQQTMPSVKFTNLANIGDVSSPNGAITFNPGAGGFGAAIAGGGQWQTPSQGVYGFTSSTGCCVVNDTGMSKISAAVVAFGNGTSGNKTGTLDFQQVNFTPVTITASATPAISTASLQTITLTTNATPTITIATGEHLVLQMCQDATGSRTWTWPASVHGGMTIGAAASTCSQQAFDSFNGTSLVAENAGISGVAP